MNARIDAAVEAALDAYYAGNPGDGPDELKAVMLAALEAALPHLAADAVPVEIPTGAIVNGAAFADRLERDYQFECQAGPLVNCSDYVEFRRCFDHLALWASQLPTLYTHPEPAALNEVSGNSGELGGDERARFEAWATTRRYSTLRHTQQPEQYMLDDVGRMWRAWQAALAATGKQQGGEALAARKPVGQEPVSPKKMERAVALDLMHAVYQHHGWKRAEGESMTARVHAIYDVTLDARRNRFVATPKVAAPPAQGIDLGRQPTPMGWSDTDFIALGNPVPLRIFRKAVMRFKVMAELGVDVESMPMHFIKSQEKYAADVIEANRLLALIDSQRDAGAGVDRG